MIEKVRTPFEIKNVENSVFLNIHRYTIKYELCESICRWTISCELVEIFAESSTIAIYKILNYRSVPNAEVQTLTTLSKNVWSKGCREQ